ncbi:hypothetical protein [Breznakia pachnodae]|uniref:Uncharacterized protein n=1 Tax=Breznakia pachnodae TaxID=265178 RepID=A0ABU0DZD1_9FIRM|nr:hypothetical protein [Breznakia pachnodae]MDQ0359997.1 hypothetical protein [Breznakia pachnodae]
MAKEKIFSKEKASLFYGSGLMFRGCDVRKKYGTDDEEYFAKFLSDETDEIIEVKLKEKPAPTVKRGDMMDLVDFVYSIKARGTGAFGANVQADLVETFTAKKCVPLNQK